MLQLNPSRLSPTEATHKDFFSDLAQNIYAMELRHALRAPPLPPLFVAGGDKTILHTREAEVIDPD